MALTPSTVRRDAFIGNKKLNCGPGSKPCGNACIPKGHKCRASWNKPIKLAAGAAALTGAAIVGTAFLHPRANMRNAARAVIEPTLQAGFGIGNVARGNWAGAAKNTANVAATGQGMGRNLRTIAEGYGTDIKGAVNRGRNAAFKWRHHRPAKRRTDSAGRACGQSFIAAGKTCHQKGAFPTGKAIAAGLGVAALGVGAYALSRRGSTGSAGSSFKPSGSPRLPGLTPKALLAPAPPRQSKTQRMRANTAAAIRTAEGRIAQTAREEVRRIAQIGNTMAATGEAAGMATKTALREVRLRTEAARRRWEPGYRSPDQRRLPGGVRAQLPESGLTPERVALPIDPRTGQPRRRRAQGFGRRDSAVVFYGSRVIDPARRDADDGKKYTKVVTNPETGRKNRVRYGAKGYRIAPGTDKGDNYCTRSFGDMKSEGYDCSGAERNTPLCLSRAKWKCSGKTSRRGI